MKRLVGCQLKALLLTLLFGLGLACLCGSCMVTVRMGHLTVEQILFHLRTPLAGVSPKILVQGHSFCNLMVISMLLFWTCCSGLLEWCWGQVTRKQPGWGRWPMRIGLWITVALWLVMVTYVSINHDIGTFAYNLAHPSRMIDEHYVAPARKDFQAPEKKRNLVVIVSESLERTYANRQLFGDNLLKELQAMEDQGICFHGQITVNGTDSTIASIGGIFYGLPRLLVGMEGWHNYISGNLFHGSTSILHVLHDHGYSIWHIQGGDLDFADTRSLFEDFPDAHLLGMKELQQEAGYQQLVRKHADYAWGVNDHITLDVARRTLTEAARTTGPFFMSISTLDSHYDGYLEPGKKQEFGDFRDIVRAQSQLLADFLEWLSAQPFSKETTVVLVGDHYVMRDDVGTCNLSTLTNGTTVPLKSGHGPERSIYSCIFNSVHSRPQGADRRLFCSFDWAPTVLESIGFRWPSRRFGLGVSLYSDEPTLLEKVGGAVYERESRRRSETYGKILSAGQSVP